MESAGVKPQISKQAPTGVKSEYNLAESSDEKKSENQVGINYKVVDGEYTDKEITIKYPQITDLDDDDIQKRINEILKAEALSVLGFYEDSNDVYIDISYKIPWQSQTTLSVQYVGYEDVKGAAYPLRLFYTVNINIDKGSKLTLKDFVIIDDNLVDSFMNFKEKDPETNQASASAFDYILNTYTAQDLIRYFEGADSSYQNSTFVFSYLTKDAIGISIEVPHAVGEHMEIEIKYQDIKNNINTKNELNRCLENQLRVLQRNLRHKHQHQRQSQVRIITKRLH